VKHELVKSSNIASIGYDEQTQTMEIRFTTSQLYQYEHVPVVLHMQLMAAHSKGQYFSRNIKNNPAFPCKLVKETEAVPTKLQEAAMAKGIKYTNRHGDPCSQACYEGRHSECTDDYIKCHCTFRGEHKTPHAYANTPVGIIPEEKLKEVK